MAPVALLRDQTLQRMARHDVTLEWLCPRSCSTIVHESQEALCREELGLASPVLWVGVRP
jgi:hypothetical protein